MNEDDQECRKEGKEAFLSNPYDRNRNPYGMLSGDEEMNRRNQWRYGWEDAQREEER